MNRVEFALLVRKISVPDPVICGVFALAASILVNQMTQDYSAACYYNHRLAS